MNLKHYIQGIRKGRDINFLEREAMKDSFLAEALEGYDKVRGDHSTQIECMTKQIAQQTRSKNKVLHNWSIAASILLLIVAGIYFLQNKFSSPDYPAGRTAANPAKLPEVTDPDYETVDSSSIETANHTIESNNSPKLIIKNNPDLNLASSALALDYPAVEEKTEATAAILPPQNAVADSTSKVKEKKPETVDANTQKKMVPKPAIGSREYEKYLKNQMIRPTGEENDDLKGKVTLSFFVNSNGRPYDISVTNSLSPAADAEAVRLLKEGPGWTAGEEQVSVEVKF